jgi:phosphatidylglycerol:prolipoprotein diacylglycerol transferase
MHPILLRLPAWLGAFEVPTYGVLMGLGILAGAGVFALLAGRHGHDRGRAFEAALETILVAVIVSKVVGLLFQPDSGATLLEKLTRTGGVWYVGFLAGVGWAAWRFRTLGIPTKLGLDLAAAAVASGHWIGRLGCLMAGCCWGSACDRPWAVTFTNERAHALTGVPLHVPLHPTQLYEAGTELLLAVLLVTMLWRRWHRFPLQVGLTYLVAYAAIRFTIELFRDDPRGGALGLSTSQWIALAVFATSLPFLVRGLLRPSPPPGGGYRKPARS